VSLYPYQKKGVTFLVQTRRALLADDMGLGKTLQAIFAAHRFWKVHGHTVLVLCPKTVLSVWKDELTKWWPDATVTVVSGNAQKRRQAWEVGFESDWTLCNYEAFRIDALSLPRRPWQTIVCDEAHRLKNRGSKIFKVVRSVARWAQQLFLLTGTPIPNHPTDIWASLHLMDPKRFSSYWKFVDQFCKRTWNGFTWELSDVKPAMREEFSETIASRVLRRTTDQVGLDLPELTAQRWWVDLSPAEWKAYKQLRDEYWLQLPDGGLIWSSTTVGNLTRLRLATFGPTVLRENAQSDEPLNCTKAEVLSEIAEGVAHNRPVVVFCDFKLVLRGIRARLEQVLGRECALFTGDVKQADREDIVRDFQRGRYPFLLATPQTGGLGITLTASSLCVFLSLDWIPATRDQARKRLHRIGQTWPVLSIEVCARNTVDSKIQALLERKEFSTELALAHATWTPEVVRWLFDEADTPLPKLGTATTDLYREPSRIDS